MNFDLNNAKCWQPFFSKATLANELRSIQPETLQYYPTDQKYVKELESKIETKLREKLEEWRPRHITKLNRYGCTALRQILTRIEKSRDEVINTQPEELAQILNSYRMSGFPINLPYTNINAIFDAVYATQVHAIPSSDIEFALAAHIYAYPNTVLSVWVYVATLVRKK
jgi:coiled-coil and C2 domain-containing protein 2A